MARWASFVGGGLALGAIAWLVVDQCRAFEDYEETAEVPHARGTLTITNGSATTSLVLDGCWSGQMLQFSGVDVFHGAELGRRLRVVDDPVHGVSVVLLGVVGGGAEKTRVVLGPSACTKFDVQLVPANDYLNDIRAVRGKLELACTLPDGGGALAATVVLTDCTFDNRARPW